MPAADQLKLPEAAESTAVSMDAARNALFGDELEPGDSVDARNPSASAAPAPAAAPDGADRDAPLEDETAGRMERALFLVRNLLWAAVALMVVAGFLDDRSEWMLFILGGSILTCCVWGSAADKAARRNKRNLQRHQRQQDPVASDASVRTDPKAPSWDRQVHTANVYEYATPLQFEARLLTERAAPSHRLNEAYLRELDEGPTERKPSEALRRGLSLAKPC